MTDRPVQPPDPTRRRFFREFAGDVLSSVGSVVGVAQVLQQQSAEAARDLLAGDAAAPGAPGASGAPGGAAGARRAAPEIDASTAGWRAPFRWDGDVCLVVDQRRLPDVLAEIEVRGAADAVTAIQGGAISGGAVQAQLAAVTLALVAGRSRASRPFARRATIRGAASALRSTRPGSAAMGLALDRMLALLETFDGQSSGEEVEAALRAEAEAIIGEASLDHGALVGHALTLVPGEPGSPLRLLTMGSTGAMGGGQFGTALSAIVTLHHEGRPVHALVAETRPSFEGARVAAWELAQAGVGHALVTDAAAASCIAEGEVDAVLVTAERIAANGDVLAPAGTYGLALAAAAAGIPFLVLAATPTIDTLTPDGGSAPREEGRPGPVLTAGGTRIAPEGTAVRNPRLDLTPARLVTAIVTEEGVARSPFEGPLADQVGSAAARRSTAAGFGALLAKRAAAAGAEAADAEAETADAETGADAAETADAGTAAAETAEAAR
jgi:methylthioribose-1-phosphate isomerase